MSEPVPPEALLQQADFVRAIARTLVGDEHAAEDVEQEAWLRAFERRRPLGNLRAWLAAVTRNLAGRVHRGAGRRAAREAEAARPEAVPSTAEREASLRSVLAAVLDLEEPTKTAILLRYYEDLPAAEIAARTGAPLATVRSRLQRGVARLRERLDREHGGDRSSWCAGLVASLGLEGTSETVGVVIMAGKVKLALAAGVCALGAVGLWRVLPSHPAAPEARAGVEAPRFELAAVVAEEKGEEASEVAPPAGTAAERVPVASEEEPAVEAEERVTLRGRVVDRHGAPVPTAFVITGDTRSEGDPRLLEIPVDADGWFDLDFPRGTVGAFARAPGFTPSKGYISQDPPALVETVLVLGPGGAAARGVVRDPDGELVAGVRVHVWEERQIIFVDEEGGEGRGVGAWILVTDADGAFVAEGLSPGKNELVVETDAFPDARVPLNVGPGDVEELVITLERGESIRGTITDETGRPAAGVAITLTDPAEWEHSVVEHALNTYTADDGTFAIDRVAPGEAKIWASHPELGGASATLVVERGRTTWWDPRLERERVLRGRVVDDEGEPLAGWRVLVQGRPQNMLLHWKKKRRTGADGRFSVPNCPDWPLIVQVYAPDREDVPVLVIEESVVAGGPELELRVPATAIQYAELTGTLLDHAGEPFGKQVLFLARDDSNTITEPVAVDASSGAFRFAEMPPATYVLCGWIGGFGYLRLGEFTLAPGERRDVGEIRTKPPGVLVVTVTRAPELFDAVPEFRVWCKMDGEVSAISHTSRGTMPERLELQPGEYVLSARGRFILLVTKRFEIRAGEDTPVEIELERGTMRGLEIHEPDGAAPAQSVSVVVRDLATGEIELEKDFGRGWRENLGGGLPLEPGDWKLEATTDTGLRYAVELHLEADEKVEVGIDALVDD